MIVPFTGAGISTECGIPDFRSPGGLWTKNQPIPFDAFIASQEMRDEAWRRRFAMEENFAKAKPGRGHRALAVSTAPARSRPCHPEYRQPASGVGHRRTTLSSCTAIRPTRSASTARALRTVLGEGKIRSSGQRAPDCDCGGYIKTATVSFGQAMPAEAMQRAEELTKSCDLFLAVGSSLVVWPAAGFPLMAKRNGAALVIINREPTEFDELADLVVRNDIGDALAPSLPTDSRLVALCIELCASAFCPLPFKGRCYLRFAKIRRSAHQEAPTSGGARRHGVGRD